VQPLIAATFAVRDGIRDARLDHPIADAARCSGRRTIAG
jgi:hypothetical protein